MVIRMEWFSSSVTQALDRSLQATCRRIQIRLRRISTMAMRTEPVLQPWKGRRWWVMVVETRCVAVELWSYMAHVRQIWSNMIKYDQIWSNMIKYVNIEIWSELDKSDNLDMVPGSNGHHRSWENIPAKGLYYVVFTRAKLIQLTTKVIWPVEYCAWTPGLGSRVF